MIVPPGFLQASHAYLRTLALARVLSSRARITRYQVRQTARLLRAARADIPFYRTQPEAFGALPILDKAAQQARFEALNAVAFSLDAVRDAVAAGRDTLGRLYIGCSTGTSGNRGYFVISPAERFAWLGTIVAKAVPSALLRRTRVALALPGFSALYRSASAGSRVALAFFDLAQGVAVWRGEFRAFAPQVVVAPPAVLRQLAEADLLRGIVAFSAAEVLDPLDRAVIEAASGRPLREIYMATEGLFGVSCRHGTLHLAEDVVRFEWERVAGSALVTPIVTDLVRRVQPMIRYRMNDMLELSDAPCPCGSAFQAVAQVHGRQDDAFVVAGDGETVVVTPDVLRNAVVDADPHIADFRVTQRRDGRVTVTLDAALPDAVHDAARTAVARVLAAAGATPLVESARGIAPRAERKLRRIEREPL